MVNSGFLRRRRCGDYWAYYRIIASCCMRHHFLLSSAAEINVRRWAAK